MTISAAANVLGIVPRVAERYIRNLKNEGKQKQVGSSKTECLAGYMLRLRITLATTCLEKEVLNYRLQAILDLHSADIGELLGTMADKKNLLKKNYKGRRTTYTLNIASETDDMPLFSYGQHDNPTVSDQVTPQVIGQVCRYCSTLHAAREIMTELGLRDWKNFQKRTLKPLLALGVIERTQPDSPRNPTQKYRLTEKGRAYLEKNKGKA